MSITISQFNHHSNFAIKRKSDGENILAESNKVNNIISNTNKPQHIAFKSLNISTKKDGFKYDNNKVSTPKRERSASHKNMNLEAFTPPAKSLVTFQSSFVTPSASTLNVPSSSATFKPSPDNVGVNIATSVLETPALEAMLHALNHEISLSEMNIKAGQSKSSILSFQNYAQGLLHLQPCQESEVMTHVLQNVRDCIDANKEVDFKVYPKDTHWKIALELGMKSSNNGDQDALKWFQMAAKMQPSSQYVWLEYSKYVESIGDYDHALSVVGQGWLFCQKDVFLLKAMKLLEKVGNLQGFRGALSCVEKLPINLSWKLILEAIKIEIEDQKFASAKKLYKYLMKSCPKTAPVYIEASEFEEKQGNILEAKSIIEEGLTQCPKFSPLWFVAGRIFETYFHADLISGKKEPLILMRNFYANALDNVTKELLWKVYFEAGSFEARYSNYKESRAYFADGLKFVPLHSRWKLWLAGGRMEMRQGNEKVAKVLIHRAEVEVSSKYRSFVTYESARLNMLFNNYIGCQKIVNAKPNDWRLRHELILFEIRYGMWQTAIQSAEQAVKDFPTVGRFWSILMQLKMFEGEDSQLSVFKQALQEAPKSGEVWCEGARLLMNPTSKYFNLSAAADFLNNAIKFTPQYGDSFIELLRLELLTNGADTERISNMCINVEPSYGALWFQHKTYAYQPASGVLNNVLPYLQAELHSYRHLYQAAMVDFEVVESKIDQSVIKSWGMKTISGIYNLYPNFEYQSIDDKYEAVFASEPIMS